MFRNWSNFNYLLDFFLNNLDDLQSFFHVQRVREAIQDTFEDADELEKLILDFLKANGIFDQDSFIDYVNEE